MVTLGVTEGRAERVLLETVRIAAALIVLAFTACGSATPAPPGSSPAASPASSPLGLYQVKFALMDSVGKPAYCDPDFYPLARDGGEQSGALTNYPAIQADSELFAAITTHEHLPATNLTDAQKLTLYRAWKLLRAFNLTAQGSGYSFKYRVEAGMGYQMVAGTITRDGRVSIVSRTASGPPVCPICLAAWTLIATPTGEIRVTDIAPGVTVWTETAAGVRVAAPVTEIGSMSVPPGHLMVHLRLGDGRELLVSPGHPTADGRVAGALRPGDRLDGSVITLWELVPYSADRTYDILPAGATGHYWANGILMASTLAG